MILQIRVHYRWVNKRLRQEVMRGSFVTVVVEHAKTCVTPKGRVLVRQFVITRFPLEIRFLEDVLNVP